VIGTADESDIDISREVSGIFVAEIKDGEKCALSGRCQSRDSIGMDSVIPLFSDDRASPNGAGCRFVCEAGMGCCRREDKEKQSEEDERAKVARLWHEMSPGRQCCANAAKEDGRRRC
jgi:hypothetical protein